MITKTKLSYPISLKEAKRHLKVINFNDDDDYITQLISAATQQCENYIGKDIAKTRNVVEIDDFCSDNFRVNEGNFLEVETVITDASTLKNVENTTAYYNYFTTELTESISSDPLTITFTTGYEDDECPEIIKQAILVKIADMYDVERTSYEYSGYKDNRIFERMLEPYKQILF